MYIGYITIPSIVSALYCYRYGQYSADNSGILTYKLQHTFYLVLQRIHAQLQFSVFPVLPFS